MSTWSVVPGSTLRAGVILELARRADIRFRGEGRKRAIRCPFHQDQHASAFLDPATNVFYCSVCTPDGGWTAKYFAERLGVPWPRNDAIKNPRVPSHSQKEHDEFTPTMAREVWGIAQARAVDDENSEADALVYSYLHGRGLGESWEHGSFGILAPGMALPAAISSWASRGYRLIAPSYNGHGEVACVQSRNIGNRTPKTLCPAGSQVKGTVFASASGLEVLRGTWNGEKQVVFGEGLTDYLALSTVSPIPVLCAPGTSMAAGGIGPWIEGFEVFVALDWDEAGEKSLGPTAESAYRFGATRVCRIEWPRDCNDACDVVQEDGLVRLASFLGRALDSGAS